MLTAETLRARYEGLRDEVGPGVTIVAAFNAVVIGLGALLLGVPLAGSIAVVNFVAAYIRHRHAREASILHRLAKGAADIPTIVRAVYIGLDPRLAGAAGYSVLAHLEDMTARGEVATDGPPSISGAYRLAGS